MSKVIEKPQLSFTEALREARGKLLQFNGRSRRSEFWWCALALLIAESNPSEKGLLVALICKLLEN